MTQEVEHRSMRTSYALVECKPTASQLERWTQMWAPADSRVYRNPTALELEIEACFRMLAERTQNLRVSRAELMLAMLSLVRRNLSLAPQDGQTQVLAFWNKKRQRHDVVPYVTVEGQTTLLKRQYPSHERTTVNFVLKGDEWDFAQTHLGIQYTWKPGPRGERATLVASSKINEDALVAGIVQMEFGDRPPIPHVFLPDEIWRRVDRIAKKVNTPWETDYVAMLAKTLKRMAMQRMSPTPFVLDMEAGGTSWRRDMASQAVAVGDTEVYEAAQVLEEDDE